MLSSGKRKISKPKIIEKKKKKVKISSFIIWSFHFKIILSALKQLSLFWIMSLETSKI